MKKKKNFIDRNRNTFEYKVWCFHSRRKKTKKQKKTSKTTIVHVCDDVDNGLNNTCEVIRQETVLFSTPETDYIIYD